MSDPKYHAVLISRERLYDDSEDGSVQEHQDGDETESTSSHAVNQDEDEDLNEEEDAELQSQPEDDAFGSASDSEPSQSRTPAARTNLAEAAAGLGRIDIRGGSATPGNIPQPEGDIASNLRITHEADKKKGRAVSRQIVSPSVHLSTARLPNQICRRRPRTLGNMGYTTGWTHPITKGRHRSQSPSSGSYAIQRPLLSVY